jgi:hypothetical protein
MTTSEKIIVFVGNEKIELTGEAKQTFIAQREADLLAEQEIKSAKEAKAQARILLLNRLGITEDEAKLLLS